MFESLYKGIVGAAGVVASKNLEFVNKFAPIPDYTMAFNLFMDTLGLVVPAGMAPVFNNGILTLPERRAFYC